MVLLLKKNDDLWFPFEGGVFVCCFFRRKMSEAFVYLFIF